MPVPRNGKQKVPATWRAFYRAEDRRGLERIRRANFKHGRFTKRAKVERAKYQALLRACREMLACL